MICVAYPIRTMAHTSSSVRRLYPLLHSCHVTLVGLVLLFFALYFACPFHHNSQLISSSSHSLSPSAPPSSVCQCLDGLFSSLLGSLSSSRRSLYLTPRPSHFNSYRSTFLLHLLLLLSGDVALNPGPENTSTSLSFASLNIRSASSITDELNKPIILQEFISDHSLEILSLTETWLSTDTPPSILHSLTPDNFSLIHNPRIGRTGGGTAVIYRSFLKATVVPLPDCTSFEALCVNFSFSSHAFTLLTIYRPPSSSLLVFMTELSTLLSDLVTSPRELFVTGDFNIHVDDCTAPGVTSLTALLDSFGLSQHVNFCTHISGHTLDLLISRSSSQTISDIKQSFPALSDHYAVHSSLQFPVNVRPSRITKTFRCLSKINYAQLNSDILSSELYSSPASNLSDYLSLFKSTLSTLLDKHAPMKTVSCKSKPDKPFITQEIREQKAKRARLETIYRKTKTQAHKDAYKAQAHHVTKLITTARREYYRNLIVNQATKPRKLWNTLNTLLSRAPRLTLPTSDSALSLASTFLTFFGDKISKLQSALPVSLMSPHITPPVQPPLLSEFTPATTTEVRAAILASSDATCSLDFIPTVVLKSCIDSLLTPVTTLINLCLSESTFPSSFKTALVKPLLKKHSLPKDDLSSYRPISNLNFLSKLLERVIHNRLVAHLNTFDSISPFQSAYRKFHSVETALLRIQNDLLLAIDKRHVTALILLDLSAAFDTIDHDILLTRLSSTFGISGPALNLLMSYITDRHQFVSIDSDSSDSSLLTTGVPQGSVLGPLLFTLYTTPLSYLLRDSDTSFHLYADDTQLYISFSPEDPGDTLSRLSSTLDSVHSWLSSNKLIVNPSKTEFLLVGSNYQRSKLVSSSVIFKDNVLSPSATVRNLGVTFDSNLSLTTHISSVCRSSYHVIRQLRQIRSSLDHKSCVLLANALVSSKLDFCNSLYYGLPESSIHRLQLVQNSLSRVVCPSVRRRDHISPTLRQLHWLPITSRITFKLALITYKTLQYKSPSYLHSLLTPYTPARNLRSRDKLLLVVPPLKSSSGRRSFSYAAANVWNSLPLSLRSARNLHSFRSGLKTHLFPP